MWNPYVWSDTLTQAFGETAQETTFNCIRAVMNGEESFEYGYEEDVYNLMPISYVVCPYLFEVINYSITPDHGVAHIGYTCSKEDAKAKIDAFGKEVESILNAAVKKSDSDEVKAMMIYYEYSKSITYDYSALEETETDHRDVENEMSAYKAMMERTGVCQFFAEALAHLYLQCGIECNLAGGESPEYAHMFVYLKLDGEEIFLDPTWEDTHDGTGLSFFGIDTKFYNDHEYEVDSTLLYDDPSYTGNITSEKYKPLWKMQKINDISRTEDSLVIDYVDADGNNQTYTVKN